jgi:chemotaxis protein MotB
MKSDFNNAQVVPAGGKGDSAKAKSIPEVKAQMEKLLKPQIENKSVRVTADERGLTISLSEAGFFNPGSEVLQPPGVEVLDQIVAHLLTLPNPVRVEGHTDNIPIHTPRFESNWQLSEARADYILKYLIAGKVSPERMSVNGYGEYHPVASNDTPEGRAMNRRVDVVILGEAAQKLEPK